MYSVYVWKLEKTWCVINFYTYAIINSHQILTFFYTMILANAGQYMRWNFDFVSSTSDFGYFDLFGEMVYFYQVIDQSIYSVWKWLLYPNQI